MAWCQFERDNALSVARGKPERPHVYRCDKCGIITPPTAALKVRRKCTWFDPKKPGFAVVNPCWCQGLGDVVQRLVSMFVPKLLHTPIGRLVDRIEQRLTNVAMERDAGKGCQGCTRRRITLNRRFPLQWLRKKICPPLITVEEVKGDPIPVCLSFAHGFGDAVQFTAVLRHLQKHRPQWRIGVYCKAGAHTLFEGLCERVAVADRDNLGKFYREEFALVHPVRWLEPVETYSDSPSTKVERCLREEFGIMPEPELWQYQVQSSQQAFMQARSALQQIADADGARFPVVAIHYQGNSWRSSKNLDEQIARDLVARVRAAGLVPLILDWERGYRSSILKEKARGVKCFGWDHPLWNGLGTGDGRNLHALLSQVALVVGIDSGPEHLAVATGTQTIVAWGKKTHPVNYFCPAPNVLHVVRGDQGRYIFGDRDQGERFFRDHYRYHVLRTHLRVALPELVERELASYATRSPRRLLDS